MDIKQFNAKMFSTRVKSKLLKYRSNESCNIVFNENTKYVCDEKLNSDQSIHKRINFDFLINQFLKQ